MLLCKAFNIDIRWLYFLTPLCDIVTNSLTFILQVYISFKNWHQIPGHRTNHFRWRRGELALYQ